MMNRWCLLLLVACGLSWAGIGVAAELYQWRDDAGQLHFTDNPMEVPAQYRDLKRSVGKLEVVSTSSAGGAVSSSKGELWMERCAACHHVGRGKKGNLVGLGYLAVNKVTRFPNTPQEVFKTFREAANGRIGDMKPIQISDDDLLKIARYFLGAQEK
jgi:hypothetical protein